MAAIVALGRDMFVPKAGPYLPRIMSHKDLTQPIWGQQENLISRAGKSLVYKLLQKTLEYFVQDLTVNNTIIKND